MQPDTSIHITGVMVNYYFICRTKLWLFAHNMQMEKEFENVKMGKLLHETSYKERKKELIIDGYIALDYVVKGDVLEIHDIKKTRKMEFAHEAQMLYYLYYLRRRGVDDAVGLIDYPNLRRRREVRLTQEGEEKIEAAMRGIESVVSGPMPPPTKTKICKKCAYEEFCWGDEI
ncbi:MAG: CRISPR-associated protein Cas4 [Thermoplasmata archaeon]